VGGVVEVVGAAVVLTTLSVCAASDTAVVTGVDEAWCNAPSFLSHYLTTSLVKLSFWVCYVKSWNFEGCLVTYKNQILRG
jgi:hypothetical protein